MVQSILAILSLSLAQAALVFEKNELNHLDIEFDISDNSKFTILDRVAREYEGSGEDVEMDVTPEPTEASQLTKSSSSDITAILTPRDGLQVIEDNTSKNPRADLGAETVATTPMTVLKDVTPTLASNTTSSPSNTTASPAPEPEPESGAASFGLTTALLLASIAAFFL